MLKEFNEFKDNVEGWASVRGIYLESTEKNQIAKALEEVGEYITAKTVDELKDAVGDIAVCIVNAANFDTYFDDEVINLEPIINKDIAMCACSIIRGAYRHALRILIGLAQTDGIDFKECLTVAWDSIKERKGMMVNGFYVKWDNLSHNQRVEFYSRSST